MTGLTSRLSQGKPSDGISDVSTVKLDFDDVPLGMVRFWAMRACTWFDMKGFDIFRSSLNHYHVIFARKVKWEENMRIMCWVASESKIEALHAYVFLQGIKMCSTLRVGPKGGKPSLRLVYRFGSQAGRVAVFLDERRLIKRILKSVG